MKAKPSIPALRACPGCGLGLQRGRGPHGLAWHECRERTAIRDALADVSALTVEAVQQLLLAQLLEEVADGKVPAADALDRVSSLRKALAPRGPVGRPPSRPKEDEGEKKGKDDAEMLAFLRRKGA